MTYFVLLPAVILEWSDSQHEVLTISHGVYLKANPAGYIKSLVVSVLAWVIIPISHDIYTDMLCGIYNTENNYKPHGFHTCNDLFNPVVVVFRINVFFFVWRILNHFKSELGNNFCFWAKMLMEYWLISELEMCTATTVSHAPVHIS